MAEGVARGRVPDEGAYPEAVDSIAASSETCAAAAEVGKD